MTMSTWGSAALIEIAESSSTQPHIDLHCEVRIKTSLRLFFCRADGLTRHAPLRIVAQDCLQTEWFPWESKLNYTKSLQVPVGHPKFGFAACRHPTAGGHNMPESAFP